MPALKPGLSPAKLSSCFGDTGGPWPLGCFAAGPVSQAAHRVSPGLPCVLGGSQARGTLCLPAVLPPVPGWGAEGW